MQYSLLSRFQGAMAGVSVGSRLIQLKLGSSSSLIGSLGIRPQVLWGVKLYEANSNDQQVGLNKDESLVLQMSHSLTRCQGWDYTDWKQSWKQWCHSQEGSEVEKNNLISDSSQESSESERISLSLAEIALATLPLTLLFHEQPDQLNQHIQQAIEGRQESVLSLEVEQAVLAFNLAIAFALQEEPNPTALIARILDYLNSQTYFSQQLHQVQTLIEQNVSLETAQEQLLKRFGKTAKTLRDTALIALTLYSFVSTPHDPEISILRTLQADQPIAVCSLLGALSGAYNSFSSFPLSWQAQFKRAIPGELIQGSILASATELFATWSGVYNTTNSFFEIHPTLVVAAPNIIRSRQP
ncbi:MAG: ADP-ribosylglycohydrolase family protein [Cyanobacteriota bacterium]|nr:ADP-ribosylglycohydrolase family protein [Cyanobacteriota bacterium]